MRRHEFADSCCQLVLIDRRREIEGQDLRLSLFTISQLLTPSVAKLLAGFLSLLDALANQVQEGGLVHLLTRADALVLDGVEQHAQSR